MTCCCSWTKSNDVQLACGAAGGNSTETWSTCEGQNPRCLPPHTTKLYSEIRRHKNGRMWCSPTILAQVFTANSTWWWELNTLRIFLCLNVAIYVIKFPFCGKACLICPQNCGKEASTCIAAASSSSPIQPVGKTVSVHRLLLLRVISVELFAIKNYGCGSWSFHSTMKKVFLKPCSPDSCCKSADRLSYLQAVSQSHSRWTMRQDVVWCGRYLSSCCL